MRSSDSSHLNWCKSNPDAAFTYSGVSCVQAAQLMSMRLVFDDIQALWALRDDRYTVMCAIYQHFLPSGLYRYFMRKCHQANKTQAFLQKAYEYIGLFEAFDAYCLKLGQPVTVTRDYYSATDVFTLIYNRFFLRKIKTIMSSHASTQNFSNTCISDSLLERPKDPSQFHTHSTYTPSPYADM